MQFLRTLYNRLFPMLRPETVFKLPPPQDQKGSLNNYYARTPHIDDLIEKLRWDASHFNKTFFVFESDHIYVGYASDNAAYLQGIRRPIAAMIFPDGSVAMLDEHDRLVFQKFL